MVLRLVVVGGGINREKERCPLQTKVEGAVLGRRDHTSSAINSFGNRTFLIVDPIQLTSRGTPC